MLESVSSEGRLLVYGQLVSAGISIILSLATGEAIAAVPDVTTGTIVVSHLMIFISCQVGGLCWWALAKDYITRYMKEPEELDGAKVTRVGFGRKPKYITEKSFTFDMNEDGIHIERKSVTKPIDDLTDKLAEQLQALVSNNEKQEELPPSQEELYQNQDNKPKSDLEWWLGCATSLYATTTPDDCNIRTYNEGRKFPLNDYLSEMDATIDDLITHAVQDTCGDFSDEAKIAIYKDRILTYCPYLYLHDSVIDEIIALCTDAHMEMHNSEPVINPLKLNHDRVRKFCMHLYRSWAIYRDPVTNASYLERNPNADALCDTMRVAYENSNGVTLGTSSIGVDSPVIEVMLWKCREFGKYVNNDKAYEDMQANRSDLLNAVKQCVLLLTILFTGLLFENKDEHYKWKPTQAGINALYKLITMEEILDDRVH